MVLPMFVGLCVCFLQGLSIGIEALFMVLPMFVGALGLFLARTLYWYRGIVYGTPNVCRAIVSVSCKDSLLVYMHCLLLLSMFVGVCDCFLQGLSIGIYALFIVALNVCRGLCLFLDKDSLLVYMHCLLLLSMFVGVCVCFLTRTLYWYICIVYWCSQCL